MNINSFYMYKKMEQTDTYYHFKDGDKEILVPSTSAIVVDENVGIKTLKSTATRKSIINYTEE